MEAVEVINLHNTDTGIVHNPDALDPVVQADLNVDKCPKSNGVTESGGGDADSLVNANTQPVNSAHDQSEESKSTNDPQESDVIQNQNMEMQDVIHTQNVNCSIDKPTEEIISNDSDCVSKNTEARADNAENVNEQIIFKTEVLVEKNDKEECQNKVKEENSNIILNELGQNIELNEALCSSDVTDHGENNNDSTKQEVFNKEELLDILEGNDVEMGAEETVCNTAFKPEVFKSLETQKAMQAFAKLTAKGKSKSRRSIRTVYQDELEINKIDVAEASQQVVIANDDAKILNVKESDASVNSDKIRKENKGIKSTKNQVSINVLVKDWDDDEPANQANEHQVTLNKTDETTAILTSDNKLDIEPTDSQDASKVVATLSDAQTPNSIKIEEDHHSHLIKRQSRVIKKKVIFDPDNPDTFTKGKAVGKKREPEKEHTVLKKPKLEGILQVERSKSKSPTSKMQWKKPSSKNSAKQKNRLTEVDKLLMDEGAVNMIYQLTPEATKGKKNMRTKAEFIKKLQSSTPEGAEMKFRERKKEIMKSEEEAKRISGGKHRGSLTGSVKSTGEDFEAHSADDSIIYRRHSSSSYSSACMSPLRISDLEGTIQQNSGKSSHLETTKTNETILQDGVTTEDVFMSDGSNLVTNYVINKSDCLTIKEKLNSKLALALHKRKRESSKHERPPKLKKAIKIEDKEDVGQKPFKFKFLIVNCENRLAEIFIQKTGTKRNVEALKELDQALAYVNDRKDISTTLIMSECGTLCSELDLEPLLDENLEKRTNYAFEVAETVRSVLCRAESHSKMLVSGVWGSCYGAAVALVALSDVSLAGEAASFGPAPAALPMPGLATIAALSCTRCSPTLLNELFLFERTVSAREAARGGLVSRTLWPQRLRAQLRAVAADIAAQPTQSVLLKKKLLRMRLNDSKNTFQMRLEKERDLLVEYWTSVEGQEILCASFDAV